MEPWIEEINKRLGDNSIMRLDGPPLPVEAISTGCLSLDCAIGIGGVPKGRIVEIYGPESSGKTTLCLHILAEAQKGGGTVAFIDAEHALDVQYAERLGVKVGELLISQPDSGEKALDICQAMIQSGKVAVVVVDSVAALTPKAELEGEMGDPTMGTQARLMSQAMRKLTAAISKSNTLVIFTNQLRSKIGVFYGNPETTTGGNALKFYASVRMDIRRKEVIKQGDEIVGSRVKVKIVKNKVAPPYKETEFEIYYNQGIHKANDLMTVAMDLEIIKQSGPWYSYGELKAKGREAIKEWGKEVLDEIAGKVKDATALARQI